MLPFEKKLLDSLLKRTPELQKDHAVLPLGELIRLMRDRLSMSQRQLAKLAGIAQSTVTRIENEDIKPNQNTLRKIFSAMGCDLALLPIPYQNLDSFLYEKAKKIAEARINYLEGTTALENQKPDKKWREFALQNEIESLLKNPSELWN